MGREVELHAYDSHQGGRAARGAEARRNEPLVVAVLDLRQQVGARLELVAPARAQRAAAADVARQVGRERALHDRDHGCGEGEAEGECDAASAIATIVRPLSLHGL